MIDTDNGFFRSLKEANSDPITKLFVDREQKLSQLEQHYREPLPFPDDDVRLAKLEQDRYEAKKLLEHNLQRITLPSQRPPHYGPGTTVPNSVLVRKSEAHS